DNVVSILLGNTDGTFGPPTRFGVGANPFSLAVADYDSDGKLDLVVANRLGNSISILKGDGRGSFVLTRTESVGLDPQSTATGDFNGDNEPDLVVAVTNDSRAAVLLNGTDIVAPTTLASVSPGANANGWNKTTAAVSLAATDNPGGSGVKEVRYKVGSNSEVVVPSGATAFNLTTQGVFPIHYYA